MIRSAILTLSAVALIVVTPNAADGGLCIGLGWPVPGSITAAYAPSGQYAGHWGVDIQAHPGSTVTAAAAGRVVFAGTVVENLTVTIDHGGGLKSSYSYLGSKSVGSGAWLELGEEVGASGLGHGGGGLHFSVRVDGDYVDPQAWLGCHHYEPRRALRLVG